jgi:hypothetical protein
MHVPLLELPHQAAMGLIPALECLRPGMRGAYNHVLSCHVVNAAASQDFTAW